MLGVFHIYRSAANAHLEEFSFGRVLQDEIDSFMIVEVAVQSQDVLVP